MRTLSSRGRIESAPRPPIHGGPPPDFDGDACSWSAEHLLLSAVGMCLLTTFEAFAVRDRVDIATWEARVHGTVGKTAAGLAFTRVVVELDMDVGDVERARSALADARRHCMVANALKVDVEVVPTIRAAALANRSERATVEVAPGGRVVVKNLQLP